MMRRRIVPVLFGLVALSCATKMASMAQPDTDAGTDAGTTDAGTTDAAADAPLHPGPPRVLFFTKETLYFHTEAHQAGDDLVPKYLRARGHVVTVTKDASLFTAASLANFDVALFFVTSGTVFDDTQRADFEAFIRAKKGFVGVHTANATELDSAFFRGLVGATFYGHGVGDAQVTSASLIPVDPGDSLVSFLPNPWIRTDEWHYFTQSPADNLALTQLLRVDESTLPDSYPEAGRTGVHPLAWRQEYVGARSFYTALGHTAESYQDELFLRSIALGVEWAAAGAPP